MRKIGSAFIGISILGTSIAWAASPLPPGKPAGVRQAQWSGQEYLIFGGVAAVGIGIAIATSGGRASDSAPLAAVVSAPATTS